MKNVGRFALVEAVRQERPRLGEVNCEVRQLGVTATRGVARVGLRIHALHATDTRLILGDHSNAFNTGDGRAVLAEMATCVTSP